MKRFVLLFFLFFFSLFTNAQKIWVGSVSNLWSDPDNWTPVGVPVPSDDVEINTNTEIFLLGGVTLYEVNSIKITGGVTVTLQCAGAFREVRLTSTSVATPALLIETGSTLAFRASNNITPNDSSLDLTYGTGVVGSIYGTLIIKRPLGPASNPGVRLVTSRSLTEYGIVTVYPGGIIKIDTSGGNTVSSLLPTPTLIMKDNSIYEIATDGGAFPVGTWETNSLAWATGTGINPPSFEGTDYGNLEWNCPNQTVAAVFNKDISFHHVNLISTNSANANGEMIIKEGISPGSWIMTINGNLDVGTGARLVTTSATTLAGNGGNIYVKGDINNQGTITSNGIGTANSLLIEGTVPQTFSNPGTFSGANLLFTIINPAGLTLLTPLTLPWNAEFINGKITTTIGNILTMVDDATYTGGSSASFIEGPMSKIGNDDFIFPVGVGSIYAPIGMTNVSGDTTTDVFTAEYIRANPQSIYSPAVDPASIPLLDHVSYVEYWTLKQNTGSGFKRVSLAINPTSFCRDMDKAYVGRWNGSFWTNEGSVILNPPPVLVGINETGTIRSFNLITALSGTAIAFTLATDLPFIDNPLPITLISFDATRLSNSKSLLNWELAACCSSAAKFEMQRAGKNKDFITIGTVGGSETNRFYNYTDNGLQSGINYYRLKMTDADGTITYSRTVAVMNGVKGLLLTSLIPTVVTNTASLTIAASAAQKMDIVIVDMQGRLVQKQNYSVAAGNTNIQLFTERLGAGVYQLFGVSAEGKTNWIRFIKQ